MMRRTRHASLHVEPVESRNLLGTLAPAPQAVAGEVSASTFPAGPLLTGEVRGTSLVRRGVPDAGDIYTLRGAGRVGPLGQVDARGVLQTTSLTGQPTGTVTLSNRFGVVEVRITGRPTTGGATSTETFNFEVTRATGRYARLGGTGGVIELAVGRTGSGGLANFRMGINPVDILARY
jgi:hypothetical protein